MSRGIGQMVLAHRQYKEGKKMQAQYEADRPRLEAKYNAMTEDYADKVGETSQRALNRYEALSKQGIPEEQKAIAQRNIDRNTTNMLAQQSSRRGGLAGVGRLNQQNTDANVDMLAMDANIRLQNQMKFADVAPQLEAAETQFRYGRDAKMENINFQDIYDNRAYGRALEGAAYQNWQEGWGQLDSDIMTWMGMGMGGGGAGGGQGGGGNSGQQDYSSMNSAYQGAGQKGSYRQQNENAYGQGGGNPYMMS